MVAKPREKNEGQDVRVRYFPATSTVTAEIEAWAEKSGARILSVVPLYWEDVEHEQA